METQYFDIVAGVLQGDTLAPYLFIICLDYVLRTSIDKIRENGFELTKKRSRRHPAKTITDANYADDIAILANTPNQAETLLHSLEWAAAGIGLHVNAHNTIINFNTSYFGKPQMLTYTLSGSSSNGKEAFWLAVDSWVGGGDTSHEPIVKWLERVEMICKLSDKERVECILPLKLIGGGSRWVSATLVSKKSSTPLPQ